MMRLLEKFQQKPVERSRPAEKIVIFRSGPQTLKNKKQNRLEDRKSLPGQYQNACCLAFLFGSFFLRQNDEEKVLFNSNRNENKIENF